MIKTLILIGSGSFIGGIMRYLISGHLNSAVLKSIHFSSGPLSTFPLGTFAVNISGCFLIGLLYGIFERYDMMNHDFRNFFIVGLCGGFTTFSTFINENFQLMKDSNFMLLSIYTALSLFIGLIMLYTGSLITK